MNTVNFEEHMTRSEHVLHVFNRYSKVFINTICVLQNIYKTSHLEHISPVVFYFERLQNAIQAFCMCSSTEVCSASEQNLLHLNIYIHEFSGCVQFSTVNEK